MTRSALVTGASGGIGRAVALRLAHDGFDVTLQYNGNEDAASATAREIAESGGRAVVHRADIGEETDVAGLFAAARQATGAVDVVVNAAGVMPLSPVATTDLGTFDRVMRTNVRGAFLVAQEAARELATGGAIILFSTSVTRLAQPGYAAYAMSKGAVESLPLILARELTGRDITVNAIAPGPTDTPLFRTGKSDELITRIAGLNPMARLGSPEDIAEVVAGLAGPLRWINGQTIFANGGAA